MDDDAVDLDSAIEGAIDHWRHKRHAQWTQDEDGRRTLRMADRLADLLHAASAALQPPIDEWQPELWATVRELAEDPDLWPLAKERLQINLAWKFAPYTAEMAERCLEITRVIIDANPGDMGLTRFRGRLPRSKFGAEMVHDIQPEGRTSRAT